VICVLGSKTRRIQRYCGPKVATENAFLMLSLLRMSIGAAAAAVDNEEMDSIMELGSTIIDRDGVAILPYLPLHSNSLGLTLVFLDVLMLEIVEAHGKGANAPANGDASRRAIGAVREDFMVHNLLSQESTLVLLYLAVVIISELTLR